MTNIDETMNTYRSYVTKHAYYIIALCVTSIGFSVTQTMDRELSEPLIILGISATLFLLSILFGFGLIGCMTDGLSLEIILKKIVNGQHEVAGNNPRLQQEVYDRNAKNITSISDWGTFYSKAQKWCFYLGVLSFIGWRVYEMYLLSLTP